MSVAKSSSPMDDAEAVQPIEHFDGSSDCILTKAGSKTSSVIASLSSQGAVRPAGERFFGFPNEVPLQDDLLCAIGQLALLSPFELLQIFHQLRKHGSLEMVRDDGLLADCMVGEGGVLEAKCGHRRGRAHRLPRCPVPAAGAVACALASILNYLLLHYFF